MGLTLAHDRRHVARAVLEGVALQCNDVIQAMAEDTSNKAATLYVDGGVAQSDVLLQMQADCAGIEVARPSDVETTALGAAVAAGLGSGVFGSRRPCPIDTGGTARFAEAPNLAVEARAPQTRIVAGRRRGAAPRDMPRGACGPRPGNISELVPFFLAVTRTSFRCQQDHARSTSALPLCPHRWTADNNQSLSPTHSVPAGGIVRRHTEPARAVIWAAPRRSTRPIKMRGGSGLALAYVLGRNYGGVSPRRAAPPEELQRVLVRAKCRPHAAARRRLGARCIQHVPRVGCWFAEGVSMANGDALRGTARADAEVIELGHRAVAVAVAAATRATKIIHALIFACPQHGRQSPCARRLWKLATASAVVRRHARRRGQRFPQRRQRVPSTRPAMRGGNGLGEYVLHLVRTPSSACSS